MKPKDPKEERFLHTLPGAQKAMVKGPLMPGMIKPAAPMAPPMRSAVPGRPFGMIHDYLNPKPMVPGKPEEEV